MGMYKGLPRGGVQDLDDLLVTFFGKVDVPSHSLLATEKPVRLMSVLPNQ
jgi:hypothetical protein